MAESKEVKKENLKTTKGGKDRVRTHIQKRILILQAPFNPMILYSNYLMHG